MTQYESSILVQISVMPGASIRTAFKEAILLSNRLNAGVEFKFNGVYCWCFPDSDLDLKIDNYRSDLERRSERLRSKLNDTLETQ